MWVQICLYGLFWGLYLTNKVHSSVVVTYNAASDNVFTVPEGVTTIAIDLCGGSGGSGTYGSYSGTGGAGNRITGNVAVTPGSRWDITVGSNGGCGGCPAVGGYKTGGTGCSYQSSTTTGNYIGCGGGGATYIIEASGGTIVAVGGGGGGAYPGCNANGGNAGHPAGSSGGASSGCGTNVNLKGGGGTLNAGGAGGRTTSGSASGETTDGSQLYGGVSTYAGGGGGGGYFGGGGGREGASAGGGSSYASANVTGPSFVACSSAVATLTYQLPPTAAPTAAPSEVPTAVPTALPTALPTAVPTAAPTAATCSTCAACGGAVNVIIPSNLLTIAQDAFKNCATLETVSGGESLILIDTTAFEGCDALVFVDLNATTIGTQAFKGCDALVSVNLPSATSVGQQAFESLPLLAVVNLPSVLTIGPSAFNACPSLNVVKFDTATSVGAFAFEGSSVTIVNLSSVIIVDHDAFRDCLSLTTVNLPSATTVNDNAFDGSTLLESASLSVATSIGKQAFKGCTSLQTLFLSLTTATVTIVSDAFDSCTSLTCRVGSSAVLSNAAFSRAGIPANQCGAPTHMPTTSPTEGPTAIPTVAPTPITAVPTAGPTVMPTEIPTVIPTALPSSQPSSAPSRQPSIRPSVQPSVQPTSRPSTNPTHQPSSQPSTNPSVLPSIQPTSNPSINPSAQPSIRPSVYPSVQPTSRPSTNPTHQPSSQPSTNPSVLPSVQPSIQPSSRPTMQPSGQPSIAPSAQPTSVPSNQPSAQPSTTPSKQPSIQPSTQPSSRPSINPSARPSIRPSVTPTIQPSSQPSTQPSTEPTVQPSQTPSTLPSVMPSSSPSLQPWDQPSHQPSSEPTSQPSNRPTVQPMMQPTSQPSGQPSTEPTMQPMMQPTSQPSGQPSTEPTMQPMMQPTSQPSGQPSTEPTMQPMMQPSSQPSGQPSSEPTMQPTMQPSATPSAQPWQASTSQPSIQPSAHPSAQPVSQPSASPSVQPTIQPSLEPSTVPSSQPSAHPSMQPSNIPSMQPLSTPSVNPSIQPTTGPTVQPTAQPTNRPTFRTSDNMFIVTFMGTGTTKSDGNSGSPGNASVNRPLGVWGATPTVHTHHLFVAEFAGCVILKVDTGGSNNVTTVAGTGSCSGSSSSVVASDTMAPPATSSALQVPYGIYADSVGFIYVAEYSGHMVREIDTKTGTINILAGTGIAGHSGDGGPASAANLLNPAYVYGNDIGQLFISDMSSHVVRVIDTAAVSPDNNDDIYNDNNNATTTTMIPTIVYNTTYEDRQSRRSISRYAGNGLVGSAADFAQANISPLNSPRGLCSDSALNLYIVDSGNHEVRKVFYNNGSIVSIAGTGKGGISLSSIGSGQEEHARTSMLRNPSDVWLDSLGTMFISDSGNNRIRKLNLNTGMISTIVGASGAAAFAGDGGLALSAQVNLPTGLWGFSNMLYVADTNNNRIRRVVWADFPTPAPSAMPSNPTALPTLDPSTFPTLLPSNPSAFPTISPSTPTLRPSCQPSQEPTRFLSAWPNISSMSLVSIVQTADGASNVDIEVQLTATYAHYYGNSSMVYCAAFPPISAIYNGTNASGAMALSGGSFVSSSLSSSSSPSEPLYAKPSNVLDIHIQHYRARSENGQAKVTLSNLAASSSYAVYCTVSSPYDEKMRIEDVVRSNLPVFVSTPCCKTATIAVSSHLLFFSPLNAAEFADGSARTTTSSSSSSSSTTSTSTSTYGEISGQVPPNTISILISALPQIKGGLDITIECTFENAIDGTAVEAYNNDDDDNGENDNTVLLGYAYPDHIHLSARDWAASTGFSSFVSSSSSTYTSAASTSTSSSSSSNGNSASMVYTSYFISPEQLMQIQSGNFSLRRESMNVKLNVTLSGPAAQEYRVLLHNEDDDAHVYNITTSGTSVISTVFYVREINMTSPSLLSAIADWGSSFTIAALTLPSISSARFTTDGTCIIITFDRVTNMGGLSTEALFPCADLLDLPLSELYTCSWINSYQLKMYSIKPNFDGVPLDLEELGYLIPGSMLTLRSNSSIYPACSAPFSSAATESPGTSYLTAEELCAHYYSVLSSSSARTSVNDASGVVVEIPVLATPPRVVLTAPVKVSACSDVPLDLSSSEGHGGFPWSVIHFTVLSNNSESITASVIENFLNTLNSNGENNSSSLSYSSTTSSPSSSSSSYLRRMVPFELLHLGIEYQFQVKLCNFLGLCGIDMVTVSVTEAISALLGDISGVVIHGPKYRTTKTDTALYMSGGFVRDNDECRRSVYSLSTQAAEEEEEEKSPSGDIVLEWIVFKYSSFSDLRAGLDIMGTGNDRRIQVAATQMAASSAAASYAVSFNLPPFSLEVDSTYEIVFQISSSYSESTSNNTLFSSSSAGIDSARNFNSVFVTTSHSAIVAVIKSAYSALSHKYIVRNESLLLSAAHSYDEEISSSSSSAQKESAGMSGLTFLWSCFDVYPLFGSACSLELNAYYSFPTGTNTSSSSSSSSSTSTTSGTTSSLLLVEHVVNATVSAEAMVGTVTRISVKVCDSLWSTRCSSTYIDTEIVNRARTAVDVSTDKVSHPYNVDVGSSIRLLGTVTVLEEPCIARWDLSLPSTDVSSSSFASTSSSRNSPRANNVNISSISKSPMMYNFAAGSKSSFDLFIPAGSLYRIIPSLTSARTALVFTLSCASTIIDSTSTSVSKVSASVTLMTNSPPQPGSFVVTPQKGGIALQTRFALTALLWTDDDLPLKYQFGYFQSTGDTGSETGLATTTTASAAAALAVASSSSAAPTVLSASSADSGVATQLHLLLVPQSELSFAESPLPVTCKYCDPFFVNVTLEVFDGWDASTFRSTAVEVLPLSDVEAAELAAIDLYNIAVSTEASLSAAIQFVNIVSSSLNTQHTNCSSVPNAYCSQLHRSACSSTPHTCGPCQAGYIGEIGHHNYPCLDASDLLIISTSRSTRSTSTSTRSTRSTSTSTSTNSSTGEGRGGTAKAVISTGSVLGDACTVDSDCYTDWQFCDTLSLTCEVHSKIDYFRRITGNGNASGICLPGQGTLMALNRHTEREIVDASAPSSSSSSSLSSSCKLTDTHCRVVCKCMNGFSGRWCEVSADEMIVRQHTRTQLLNVLGKVVSARATAAAGKSSTSSSSSSSSSSTLFSTTTTTSSATQARHKHGIISSIASLWAIAQAPHEVGEIDIIETFPALLLQIIQDCVTQGHHPDDISNIEYIMYSVNALNSLRSFNYIDTAATNSSTSVNNSSSSINNAIKRVQRYAVVCASYAEYMALNLPISYGTQEKSEVSAVYSSIRYGAFSSPVVALIPSLQYNGKSRDAVKVTGPHYTTSTSMVAADSESGGGSNSVNSNSVSTPRSSFEAACGASMLASLSAELFMEQYTSSFSSSSSSSSHPSAPSDMALFVSIVASEAATFGSNYIETFLSSPMLIKLHATATATSTTVSSTENDSDSFALMSNLTLQLFNIQGKSDAADVAYSHSGALNDPSKYYYECSSAQDTSSGMYYCPHISGEWLSFDCAAKKQAGRYWGACSAGMSLCQQIAFLSVASSSSASTSNSSTSTSTSPGKDNSEILYPSPSCVAADFPSGDDNAATATSHLLAAEFVYCTCTNVRIPLYISREDSYSISVGVIGGDDDDEFSVDGDFMESISLTQALWSPNITASREERESMLGAIGALYVVSTVSYASSYTSVGNSDDEARSNRVSGNLAVLAAFGVLWVLAGALWVKVFRGDEVLEKTQGSGGPSSGGSGSGLVIVGKDLEDSSSVVTPKRRSSSSSSSTSAGVAVHGGSKVQPVRSATITDAVCDIDKEGECRSRSILNNSGRDVSIEEDVQAMTQGLRSYVESIIPSVFSEHMNVSQLAQLIMCQHRYLGAFHQSSHQSSSSSSSSNSKEIKEGEEREQQVDGASPNDESNLYSVWSVVRLLTSQSIAALMLALLLAAQDIHFLTDENYCSSLISGEEMLFLEEKEGQQHLLNNVDDASVFYDFQGVCENKRTAFDEDQSVCEFKQTGYALYSGSTEGIAFSCQNRIPYYSGGTIAYAVCITMIVMVFWDQTLVSWLTDIAQCTTEAENDADQGKKGDSSTAIATSASIDASGSNDPIILPTSTNRRRSSKNGNKTSSVSPAVSERVNAQVAQDERSSSSSSVMEDGRSRRQRRDVDSFTSVAPSAATTAPAAAPLRITGSSFSASGYQDLSLFKNAINFYPRRMSNTVKTLRNAVNAALRRHVSAIEPGIVLRASSLSLSSSTAGAAATQATSHSTHLFPITSNRYRARTSSSVVSLDSIAPAAVVVDDTRRTMKDSICRVVPKLNDEAVHAIIHLSSISNGGSDPPVKSSHRRMAHLLTPLHDELIVAREQICAAAADNIIFNKSILRQFDESWGFLGSPSRSVSVSAASTSTSLRTSTNLRWSENAAAMLSQEVSVSSMRAKAYFYCASFADMNEHLCGFYLIYQLLCDLTGQNSTACHVLQRAVDTAHPPLLTQQKNTQQMAVVTLVLLNLVVFIFTIAATTKMSSAAQIAFMQAVGALLLSDILVVATMESLFIHIWVPFTAKTQVAMVRSQIYACIDSVAHSVLSSASSSSQSISSATASVHTSDLLHEAAVAPVASPKVADRLSPSTSPTHTVIKCGTSAMDHVLTAKKLALRCLRHSQEKEERREGGESNITSATTSSMGEGDENGVMLECLLLLSYHNLLPGVLVDQLKSSGTRNDSTADDVSHPRARGGRGGGEIFSSMRSALLVFFITKLSNRVQNVILAEIVPVLMLAVVVGTDKQATPTALIILLTTAFVLLVFTAFVCDATSRNQVGKWWYARQRQMRSVLLQKYFKQYQPPPPPPLNDDEDNNNNNCTSEDIFPNFATTAATVGSKQDGAATTAGAAAAAAAVNLQARKVTDSARSKVMRLHKKDEDKDQEEYMESGAREDINDSSELKPQDLSSRDDFDLSSESSINSSSCDDRSSDNSHISSGESSNEGIYESSSSSSNNNNNNENSFSLPVTAAVGQSNASTSLFSVAAANTATRPVPVGDIKIGVNESSCEIAAQMMTNTENTTTTTTTRTTTTQHANTLAAGCAVFSTVCDPLEKAAHSHRENCKQSIIEWTDDFVRSHDGRQPTAVDKASVKHLFVNYQAANRAYLAMKSEENR